MSTFQRFQGWVATNIKNTAVEPSADITDEQPPEVEDVEMVTLDQQEHSWQPEYTYDEITSNTYPDPCVYNAGNPDVDLCSLASSEDYDSDEDNNYRDSLIERMKAAAHDDKLNRHSLVGGQKKAADPETSELHAVTLEGDGVERGGHGHDFYSCDGVADTFTAQQQPTTQQNMACAGIDIPTQQQPASQQNTCDQDRNAGRLRGKQGLTLGEWLRGCLCFPYR